MASIINSTTTAGVTVTGDNSGSLQLATNNGTTAVTIDTSQNVGIGTTSPKLKLNVEGTYGNPVSSGSTPTGIARFSQTTNNVTLDVGVTTGNQVWMQGADKGDLSFKYDIVMNPIGGNLLVGTTSANGTLSVRNSSVDTLATFLSTGIPSSTSAMVIGKSTNDGSTSQIYVQFLYNNFGIGNGQINGNGSGAAAFGSYSDIRLKENVTNIDHQLENICSLRPVEFDYKTGGHQIGFIAQEMQEVYPDTVGTSADNMLTITGWSKTEARLVKAIQELNAKVDAQAVRIAELEGAK